MCKPEETIIIRDNAHLTEADDTALYIMFYDIDDEVVTEPLQGDDRTNENPDSRFHDVPEFPK